MRSVMWPAPILLLMLLASGTHAHLNIFINQEEVLKLLGINAEVFYVREGVVNTYALNFIVKIPANISDIQFSWQSLTVNPLPYALGVKYDGEGALLPPQMNISSTGVIPTSVQTFRIRLICTGLKSAQIEVQIQLNVTSHNRSYNNTYLVFRRNKICLEGSGSTYGNDSILEPESLESTVGSVYVAVACSVAIVMLILVTTSTVCIKNKKIRSQEPHYMTAVYDSNQHVFIRLGSATDRTPSAGSGSYATIASLHKAPPSPTPYATSDTFCTTYYASSQLMLLSQFQDSQLTDHNEKVRALSVPRSTIVLHELTEEGTFGRIYRGTFKSQNTVFVKTVTETASMRQVSTFLKEGTTMFGMVHKNILPILAVNSENPGQPLLVYPYANRGNLKRFLLKCRQREEKYTLSTQNLVDMSIQILLGVMYLNSQCVSYEDLATRNCVVDENLQIRITDNCLSRDLYPDDYSYYLGANNESRPIKWLAIETILNMQYNSATLVWSFGVVLWELTTLAQQPYADLDASDMYAYLDKGYRLAQPVGCPDELFAVMACCWLNNPSERPTFAQLLAYLQDFYTALGRFI